MMSRPGWGFHWSDSRLVVDRAEFDLGRVLAEEEAVSAELEHTLLEDNDAPVEILLAEYNRLRARHGLLLEADLTSLVSRFATFGAQASLEARLGGSTRLCISFICPDRPGVLATIAKPLAAVGCNVEGATMAVVARQVIMDLIVSTPPGIGVDDVKGLLGEIPQRLALETTAPQVAPLKPLTLEWPKPGSSLWHLTIRCVDRPGSLRTVTAALADRTFPLVAFSSWIEMIEGDEGTRVCVIDINFAVQPSENEVRVCSELREEILRQLPQASVRLASVEWPTKSFPEHERSIVPSRSATVLTVLGHARPGFVHAVTCGIAAASEHASAELTIVGSTMAILEGHSILTVVVSDAVADGGQPGVFVNDRLRMLLAQAIHEAVEDFQGVVLEPYSLSDVREVDGVRDRPTHLLHIEVPEQPGVLAEVASLMADRQVNIVWLVGYVLQPTYFHEWARCSLEFHIAVPPHEVDELGKELAYLTYKIDGDIEFEEWGVRMLHRHSIDDWP